MEYKNNKAKKTILNTFYNVPDSMVDFLQRNNMIHVIGKDKVTVSDANQLMKQGYTMNQILHA